eukprot:gene15989-biopygen21757
MGPPMAKSMPARGDIIADLLSGGGGIRRGVCKDRPLAAPPRGCRSQKWRHRPRGHGSRARRHRARH